MNGNLLKKNKTHDKMEIIISIIFILFFILFVELFSVFMENYIDDTPVIRVLGSIIIVVGLVFLIYKEITKIEKLDKFEKIEFVVEKKEKVSNFLYDDYYLKNNKGIISVSKIDYYNFDKGDTLIIKEKDLNKKAIILDYKKVKK